KQFIAMGAAITAVFALIAGPLMLLIGFIPNIISGLLTVVRVVKGIGTAIAILTSPISLVVIAIIAAAILVIKYWEPIKEFFIDLWEAIKESGIAIWEAISEAWESSIEFLKSLFSGLGIFFSTVWGVFLDVVSSVVDFFVTTWNSTIETFKSLWNAIPVFFSVLWETVINIVDEKLLFLQGIFESGLMNVVDI